jgi:large subunit ribosomal protein L18
MRNTLVKDSTKRVRRALRVRKHLRGTETKPRMCVVKSNKAIQVQLIDDEKGVTLGATASFAKEFRGTEFATKNKATARKLGETIGQIAKDKNIKEVVFDRGPFKYHGILAELADGARSTGLQF